MAPFGRHRRRKLYIYKEFQRNFVVGFCVAALEVMLAVSLSLTLMFSSAALREMEHLFPYLVTLNVAIAIAVIFIIYWVAMFFSHRIAGPLWRLEKLMALVGAGDLSQRVRLRKKDQLQGFACKANTMVDELEAKLQTIQGRLAALKTTACSEADPGLEREIAQLEMEIADLFRFQVGAGPALEPAAKENAARAQGETLSRPV